MRVEDITFSSDIVPMRFSSFDEGHSPSRRTAGQVAASPVKHVSLGGTMVLESPVMVWGSYLLFGQGFRALLAEIDAEVGRPDRRGGGEVERRAALETLRRIAHFFGHRDHLEDFFGLLAIVQNKHCAKADPASPLAANDGAHPMYPAQWGASSSTVRVHQTETCVLLPPGSAPPEDAVTEIWHEDVLLAHERGRAFNIASGGSSSSTARGGQQAGGIQPMSSVSGGGGPNLSRMKKDERLVYAAHQLIKVGNFRGYCDLMGQAGKWDRALMYAPMVSLDYWQAMQREYLSNVGHCLEAEERAACLLAGGEAGVEQLVEELMRGDKLREAFLVAKAGAEGLFDNGAAGIGTMSNGYGGMGTNGHFHEKRYDVPSAMTTASSNGSIVHQSQQAASGVVPANSSTPIGTPPPTRHDQHHSRLRLQSASSRLIAKYMTAQLRGSGILSFYPSPPSHKGEDRIHD